MTGHTMSDLFFPVICLQSCLWPLGGGRVYACVSKAVLQVLFQLACVNVLLRSYNK